VPFLSQARDLGNVSQSWSDCILELSLFKFRLAIPERVQRMSATRSWSETDGQARDADEFSARTGLTAPQRSSSEMGSTDCPQTRLASTDDKTSSSHTLTSRIWEDSMNQGPHPEELPAEVLDDVASVVGAEVTLLSRLRGGINGGAMRVQLAGRANAVLKAVPRAHPNHLDEMLRAQRVVER
jgi:hypothetical protein